MSGDPFEVKTALASIAQTVAISTVVLYVFGFIVVNTYLAKFGIVSLGLFEARYVPAGAFVGALLFIYIVTAGLHVYYGPEKVGELVSAGKKDGKVSTLWGIFSMIHTYAGLGYGLALATTLVGWYFLDDGGAELLIIPMLLFYMIDFPLREKGTLDRLPRFSAILLFGFYCLFIATYVYVIDNNSLHALFAVLFAIAFVQNQVQHEQDRTGHQSFSSRLMLIVAVPTVLLVLCLFVGRTLYGEVPRGVGGGKPPVVRLLFSDEAISKVEGFLPIKGDQSQLFLLIDETCEELIVVPVDADESSENAIRLRKDLVLATVSVPQPSEKLEDPLIRILKVLGVEVQVPDKK